MSLSKPSLDRRTALAALAVSGGIAIAPAAIGKPATGKRASLEDAVERLRVAMVEGDGKALDALLYEHLTYMHSSGFSQTKAKLLSDLAGQHFFATLTYADKQIDLIEDTGIAVLTVDQVKNLPNGSTRASRIRVIQTWATQHGRWILVARSSAIVSSPISPACRPAERS